LKGGTSVFARATPRQDAAARMRKAEKIEGKKLGRWEGRKIDFGIEKKGY
jgi:hypothetical protein